MFDLMRQLAKAPITGKFYGAEIENGIRLWLLTPLFLLGALLLGIVSVIVLPIFGFLQLVGLWRLSRWGHDLRATEEGVEVFSKQGGVVARYHWSDIALFRRSFNTPPFTDCELVLKNEEVVRLEYADFEELSSVFGARGIPVGRGVYGPDT